MLKLLITLMAFLYAGTVVAQEKAVELQTTKTYMDGSDFVAEFDFSGEVDSSKAIVEFINQTIQIDLPGASMLQEKRREKIASEKIKSLYIYQPDPMVLRSRIIHNKPYLAKDYEGKVSISQSGTTVKVRVSQEGAPMTPVAKKDLPVIPPRKLQTTEVSKIKLEAADDEDSKETAAVALLEKEFLEGRKKKSDKKLNLKKAVTKKSEEKYDESKMPLNLAAAPKKQAGSNPWIRLIISFVVISIVAVALIFGTKKYGKSKSKVGGNINIQMVSQQSIGPKKSLAVVRVAGEDILLGITDYNISMIKSLSFIDDEIEEEVPQNFVNELNRVTDEYVDSAVRARSQGARATTLAGNSADKVNEEFSMSSIKDIVSDKLKEMRPL